MKDSTKEALFKFGEFCDSGKPWYCFFGVYLVCLLYTSDAADEL